jgi:putative transposase
MAFLEEIYRLTAGGLTRTKAIEGLVRSVHGGELPQHLRELISVANARAGSGRTLSKSSLQAWCSVDLPRADLNERIARLAPKKRGVDYTLAEDLAQVLAVLRQPNGHTVAWCAREAANGLGLDDWHSLYYRALRYRKKIPASVLYVGRHTGAALKALEPFRRREFLSLNPNDVWVGDGHGAKLKVAHPITGSPFQPEVTVIMDVATRFVVGWSVDLSENRLAVADALRHGVARHGIPLIYYSDGGAGQTNKMFDAPITGTLGALGIHHEVGRPGNPQGRGVIERFWQTVLIPLARRFETFQGKSAVRDTLRLVSREIDRALRAVKKGEIAVLPRKLPTWPRFIEALEDAIDSYNTKHQHRSLPKLNGRYHATPEEYRATRLAGVEIHRPEVAELATLFMPATKRRASHGEVRLFNGIYFHRDLMLVDGEDVQVAYDIHDVSRVWVKKISGELIAVAVLDGNRGDFMPKPLIEHLADQRAKRRMGRLQAQMEEVQAELQGAAVIDAKPVLEPIEFPPEPENVIALPDQEGRRPMWDSNLEKYRWLMERPAEITTEDENWLGWYRSTSEFQDLFGDRRSGDDGEVEASR